jgi:diguanylate cyclase (GGDEF)-like protein
MAGTVLRPDRGGRLQLSFRSRAACNLEEHALRPEELGGVPHLVDGEVLERWLEDDVVPAELDGARVHVVPLRGSEPGMGLIVARLLPDRTLGARELALLRTLAAHASMAVENARLHALVVTDELTQLYTLRFFQQTLAREVENYHRYGQKLCLLMLDLDDFKRVNDRHGHPAGDRVLQRVAKVLTTCVREVDVVCRYGGEEFAVILPGTDGRAAAVVAERIRARVDAARVDLNGSSLHATISVGISSCPDDATSVRELVEYADRALYDAKQAGKNRVVAA